MKRTAEGIRLHKNTIWALASTAFVDVSRETGQVTADNAYRVESTLRTHVKCVRRGNKIIYTLAVPEINRNYRHEVPVNSEFEVHREWRATR